MPTLSVPLTAKLENFVNRLVREGYASNKASVVRKALDLLAEEEAIATILEAEEDIKKGRVFYGDLEEIAKKFRS